MNDPVDIVAERERRELREKLRLLCGLEASANAAGDAALAAAARAERIELQKGTAA
jgi:hypothetical protein